MANFSLELPNELMKQLENLDRDTTEMFEEMTQAGAKVVYDNIQIGLSKVIDDKDGNLAKSLRITKSYKTASGEIATKVAFYGYGKDKKPNALKVLAREYGTSRGEAKRPFIRPAFNKKNDIDNAMTKIQEKYLPKED